MKKEKQELLWEPEKIREKLEEQIWYSQSGNFQKQILHNPKNAGIVAELADRRVRYFWELYKENTNLSGQDQLESCVGEENIAEIDKVLRAEGLPSLQDFDSLYSFFKEIRELFRD
ncbi:hypothetical protein A2738_02630 [Candidatus Nomurabacteria bacterium RIFCSPHIGHO2_01_FULL_42_15]|uniref:Uncharacterized protein n=1 Tax=Candidatus Nomurabacteria bacterium RIFCSPHIGHO2_01_FULL_42_15 TaxID=1801742 RepID=A0A1F6VEI8_9BACT|nr:MAG: hypothetical protein A2738_02630 [Candidatus Nomurabacteria bacterium RIFCSPHIGHO2_01_FULL_42_15]OGI92769.1 MAG: hypothetical protein A3A99_02695 [Candidatus Nomurabacteria bacterium RIFCSPLOWO2_01_FULL_41_18]